MRNSSMRITINYRSFGAGLINMNVANRSIVMNLLSRLLLFGRIFHDHLDALRIKGVPPLIDMSSYRGGVECREI